MCLVTKTILLIDFVNPDRRGGKERREACLAAASAAAAPDYHLADLRISRRALAGEASSSARRWTAVIGA